MADFSARLAESAGAVEQCMACLLPAAIQPLDQKAGAGKAAELEAPLLEAMGYASLGGGKRLRGFLVVESADLFDVPRERSLRAAAAVEFVHAYSLVHDDLPAMDDSDTRRGRPSCHKAFDEATAILAGDGLLTFAFEVLAAPETHADGGVRARLVAALARAAGPEGMVGGQMIDLRAETLELDRHGLQHLQSLKTGALIAVSAEAGALLGGAEEEDRQALLSYAHGLGRAFQIADDLLDAEGDAEAVGKPVGQDAAAGKATFVSILGVDGARKHAAELADLAVAALDRFGDRGAALRDAARFVVARDR